MRNWFQARQRREQVLITAFIAMAAVVWISSATGHLRERWQAWRSGRAELATQQLWLDRQQEIEQAAATAVKNLDPARTMDGTRLVATITTLATGAGLTPAIDSPVTQRTTYFAYHTSRVTLRRTNLAGLLRFYDELAKQAPYLNLEQIAVQTERGTPGLLNVTMQISATQIVKS